MKKFFNLMNLTIYAGSLLFPLLALLPQLLQNFKISGWGVAGCIVALVVSIIMMLFTLKKPIRLMILFFIMIVILTVILIFSSKIPKYTVPFSFFAYYYIIDILAIIISIFYGMYQNKSIDQDK